MKQQKLFHLVLSAMLIVCTTGCYDKDEIKDAEKYLFKDIQYSFEEGDGFSTYDVELLPFIMENNLNNSITTTNSPFEDTWQETTFQSNDPEAFVWMGEEDVFVNTPYMFGDELLLSGATIKYGSETTKAKGPNSSTSTFQSNDPEAFVWMGEEDVFVNTPYMFGDELLLSGATIKYGSETTKAKGPNSSTSTISIQPHCRLIIKGTLHYSKLVATYTLTFAGEYTKTEKQIKGKFIQTTPEGYTGDITMEPITAD